MLWLCQVSSGRSPSTNTVENKPPSFACQASFLLRFFGGEKKTDPCYQPFWGFIRWSEIAGSSNYYASSLWQFPNERSKLASIKSKWYYWAYVVRLQYANNDKGKWMILSQQNCFDWLDTSSSAKCENTANFHPFWTDWKTCSCKQGSSIIKKHPGKNRFWRLDVLYLKQLVKQF